MNKEHIRYTYTCKYCGTVYEHPLKECKSCGATEFTQNAYIVQSEKKKMNPVLKTVLIIIGVIVGLVVLSNILEFIFFYASYSDYTRTEYSFDTINLDDEKLYLGKKYDSTDIDYNNTIKITGDFSELYDNIYSNIYTSQFNCFSYDLPCNIEVKGEGFSIDITGLDFSYYGSSSGYVTPVLSTAGKTDKEISIYLADADGNKDKLLIEKYSRDKYDTVADYLFSDEYNKEFSVNPNMEQYTSLLIEIDGVQQQFDINYDRSTGYIEYYALKQ